MHVQLLSSEAFFSPTCSKYRSAAGLSPDPLGELTALPLTYWIKGPTYKGRRGERKGVDGMGGGEGVLD